VLRNPLEGVKIMVTIYTSSGPIVAGFDFYYAVEEARRMAAAGTPILKITQRNRLYDGSILDALLGTVISTSAASAVRSEAA
jgi:hypothetical protein